MASFRAEDQGARTSQREITKVTLPQRPEEQAFVHVMGEGQGLKFTFDIIKSCIFKTVAQFHSGESRD